jgi:uncharacterized protein YaeQ
MALRPTIFKVKVALSDLVREVYDELDLTVARHPSETDARMMARVLAYALEAEDGLAFGRGLSDTDEPDLWTHTLDGRVDHWIEVGEPAAKRIRQARPLAERLTIYAFNDKADAWWDREGREIERLGARVRRLDTAAVDALAALVERTLRTSVTVSEESAYVTTDAGAVEVPWIELAEGRAR